MTSTKNFIACLGIMSVFCLSAFAQSDGAEVNRFAEDGLAFEYPLGWSITNASTPQAQHLIVTRKGSSVQVIVVAKRGMTLRKDLPDAIKNFTDPLVEKVATTVGHNGKPGQRTPVYIKVGPIKAEGVRLQASSNNRLRTGEVIWFANALPPHKPCLCQTGWR
jgi:hypothetical protein